MSSGLRKWLWLALRLGITAGALFYIGWSVRDELHTRASVEMPEGQPPRELVVVRQTDDGVTVIEDGRQQFYANGRLVRIDGRPLIKRGLLDLAGTIRWRYLLAGVLVFCGAPLLQALRWRRLLVVQDVHIGALTAIKLSWIGLFCNQFMPGMTGGDLVKAYYITRHAADAKAESAVSVLVDRIIGLLGLLWLSAAAMLVLLVRPPQRGINGGLPWAWLMPGVVVLVGGAIFYSRTARRLLGLDRLLGRLPPDHLVSRLDRAVFLYRGRKAIIAQAFGLTFLGHVCLLGGTWLAAASLGIDVGVVHVVTFASLIFVGAGLIPAVAGVGPLEAGFLLFFAGQGVDSQAQSLGLALIVRLQQVFWALPGGLVMALGSHLPPRRQMAQAVEEAAV